MKYAYDKGIFSIAAREVITQYLPELLPADDDDGGDDNSGDENDDEDYIGDGAESIDEDRDNISQVEIKEQTFIFIYIHIYQGPYLVANHRFIRKIYKNKRLYLSRYFFKNR